MKAKEHRNWPKDREGRFPMKQVTEFKSTGFKSSLSCFPCCNHFSGYLHFHTLHILNTPFQLVLLKLYIICIEKPGNVHGLHLGLNSRSKPRYVNYSACFSQLHNHRSASSQRFKWPCRLEYRGGDSTHQWNGLGPLSAHWPLQETCKSLRLVLIREMLQISKVRPLTWPMR